MNYKKKHTITFLFFIVFPVITQAQEKLLSKFSLTWEQRKKLDKSVDETKNPETFSTIEEEYFTKVRGFLLDYQWRKHWKFQSGYSREQFINGYSILGTGYIIEISQHYLTTHMVPIRASYTGLNIGYKKIKVFAEPWLGVAAHFHKDNGIVAGEAKDIITDPMFSFTNLIRDKKEFNINPFFVLLETRVQARLEFAEVFSIYGGIGYSHGFEPIGKINATYTRPPDTTIKTLRKTNYGTSSYTYFGLSLNFAGLFEKN